MVKVIGEDESIYKICTCRKCAAKIQCLPIDIKQYKGIDYSGGSDGREWVDCPRCGNEVVLRAW